MTSRDHRDIKSLYLLRRFLKSSIARLYGLSRPRMNKLLPKEDMIMIPSEVCELCGLDEVSTFFIDGDEKNKNPQNIIALCEADKRRILHLQLRRKEGTVKPQFESSLPLTSVHTPEDY